MTPRSWLIASMTLAVLVAASVFILRGDAEPSDPLAIGAEGIGPLLLGRDFAAASAAAQQIAPATAFAGTGCFGLREIRYSGQLGELPVTVMGMADTAAEHLIEVELAIDAPLQAEDESACIALRDRLVPHFSSVLGPVEENWVVRKPVSREHFVRIGPVVIQARWFPTGRSCYVTAHYGFQASLDQQAPLAGTPGSGAGD